MRTSKTFIKAFVLAFFIVVWLFPWPHPMVLTVRGQGCPLPVANEFAAQWDVARLGCPLDLWRSVAFAREPFERGLMFWREDVRQIHVLFHDGTWWNFADTWQEGMPSSDPAIIPPAGFYQPVRGFGLVWREGAGVRDKIGWATAEEKGYTAIVQAFEKGTMFTADDGSVYTEYNDGTWPASPVLTLPRAPACPFSVPPQLAPTWQQDRLGCPIEQSKTTEMAIEPFERGLMFWREDVQQIHVLFNDGTWWNFADTWQEGMPASDPTIIPPAGLYQPVRGFGLVWREGAGVRDKIGWATAEEKGYTAIVQAFEKGVMFTADNGSAYTVYNDGTWPTLQTAPAATPTSGPEVARLKVWETAGYQRAKQELQDFKSESAHFSPDGRQFVASTGPALYLMATDGSSPVAWLAAAPAGYHIGSDVLWSPDGRYLAFFVYDPVGGGISNYNVGWVSSTGGTTQVLVTNSGQSADWPRWTQDGRLLFTIYQGADDHVGQVWLFNPDDGTRLQPTEPLQVSAGIVGQQHYPWKPGKFWTPQEGGTYVEDY